MRIVATLAFAALMTLPSFAQDGPKPGPEHEMLKKMEGNWTTTMKAGGQEFKGTVKYKMELGGLWLVSTMESEMFGMKFTGKGHDSYDAVKQKFTSVWMDSMSTSPVVMEGTYDKAKKTLTLEGAGPGENGKTSKYKSVTEMPDDDTHTMTMYMGDTKEPSFVVVYKRKK